MQRGSSQCGDTCAFGHTLTKTELEIRHRASCPVLLRHKIVYFGERDERTRGSFCSGSRMENTADVRTIMARFQANASTSEEGPSAFAGRPKQPLHPTTSGPGSHMNKPMREGSPGGGASGSPKPSFLKNSSNSEAAGQEPSKTKALAGIFDNSQEETNKPFLKHKSPSKPSFTPASEAKTPPNRGGVNAAGSDHKPAFPKPAPGSDPKPAFPKPALTSTKPAWVTEDSTPSVPKIPPAQLKPNNSFFKLQQQVEAKTEVNAGSANKPSLPVNAAAKPSNFRAAQNLFNKDAPEQPDSAPNSIPPPKPAASKKPSLRKAPHIKDDDPSAPKKNPLTNSLALGPAPAKPNRPPNVNLDSFKKDNKTRAEGPVPPTVPPHPASHPGNHSNNVTPAPAPAPSLPPRHPGAINQTEELYDDVDGLTTAPPPLPPVHPSQLSKGKDDSDDGEMYEDLDDRWEAAEQKQEKKEKEDKKRLEAERKEQKEREKKEHEARKRFKLDGPIEVLQKGKACVDCKGSKTDLGLKQGDSLDIIRILGNPEGKWLGRAQDGSVGYVKIGSVKIDYDSLKQQTAEPEVYDDIDTTPAEQSKAKRGRALSKPDPGEEIYDDVDSHIDARLPQSQSLGETDQNEEIYDDVDSQGLPPSSSMISNPKADPKKMKKIEKEEKELRKKFKFEGEIKVLHQITIIQNLTNKKWSSKELPLKAGEKLDVIAPATDNKFLCRNEDGKFGYVSTSYVVTDDGDGDIYDDIGDDNIYDND